MEIHVGKSDPEEEEKSWGVPSTCAEVLPGMMVIVQ